MYSENLLIKQDVLITFKDSKTNPDIIGILEDTRTLIHTRITKSFNFNNDHDVRTSMKSIGHKIRSI